MNGHSLARSAPIVFAIVAACASSVPASAASIVVLVRNPSPEMKVTGTHFGVDVKTRRADPQAHPSVALADAPRNSAATSSGGFWSLLDKLYSVDPMFRLDDQAMKDAADAGKPGASGIK